MIPTLCLRFMQLFARIYKSHLIGYTLRMRFCPARDEEERGFEHILTRIILKTLELLLDPQPF
jgi:hypothetical protein